MNVVLFGVGQHTGKFISIIKYFGRTVSGLTDNDEKKAGMTFYGIKVVPPQVLLLMDCKIIISCIHQKEIETQLSEMGMGNRVISLSSFLNFSCAGRIWNSRNYVIGMDLWSKAKWGGAENWNIILANALAQKGETIAVTCVQKLEIAQDLFDGKSVELICFRSQSAFGEIVDYYKEKLPLVFVNSFYGYNFFAVLAVKRMYPEQVRIINVIHNDRKAHYALAVLFDEWIDKYLCVSSKIKETLVKVYGISEEKTDFLYQPIALSEDCGKKYSDKEPLQLGIASRLVKEQKRCDQIPRLINYLEEEHVDYVMNIAGDGELSEIIYDYVRIHGLLGKVCMLGYLSKEKMIDFWEAQDIYINISEYEGTSLSMLEAMERGCVPLMTDVSGVRDYVCDGHNGFIFDIGDLYHMAEKIKFLDLNRILLREMGMAARQEILSKCNVADYANKLLEIVEGMS